MMRFNFPLVGSGTVILVLATAALAYATTDDERVQDVHAIAALAERFKARRGFYPLADLYGNVPLSVHITRQPLPEEYRYPPPGVSGIVWTTGEFLEYLREALGQDVSLPSDDRPVAFVPPYAPTFYVYFYDGRDYFVSTTLTEPTELTRTVRDAYFKYEVGSVKIPERRIHRYEGLAIPALTDPSQAKPESTAPER